MQKVKHPYIKDEDIRKSFIKVGSKGVEPIQPEVSDLQSEAITV